VVESADVPGVASRPSHWWRWAPVLSLLLLLVAGALPSWCLVGRRGSSGELHLLFGLFAALLVGLYLLAGSGARPVLRALALATLLVALLAMALLLLEPLLLPAPVGPAPGVRLGPPSPSWVAVRLTSLVLDGLAALLLVLHWGVTPAGRGGPALRA